MQTLSLKPRRGPQDGVRGDVLIPRQGAGARGAARAGHAGHGGAAAGCVTLHIKSKHLLLPGALRVLDMQDMEALRRGATPYTSNPNIYYSLGRCACWTCRTWRRCGVVQKPKSKYLSKGRCMCWTCMNDI